MNRSARAHRSTKIPNVKLRPAQRDLGNSTASLSKQAQNKRSRQQDDLLDDREDAAHFRQLRDDGHDHGAHLDADFIGTSARPLKGAIISITGLSEVKSSLTQYARELGARVEGNLTEDVTHLIADRPGSEKYRFALELGMHIVSPEWILDVREAWLSGEDVDAQDLERKHQLPALSNITICFSALGGAERRRLVALAQELGATVSDELRFDGTITHLVSATADPNASSSVRHLLHFLDRSRHGRNGTREQAASRILAVRPEWLGDCRQAAGCLSEQTYSIFAPLPDQSERQSLIRKVQTKIPSPFVREQEPVTIPFQSPFIASNRSKLALAESDSLSRNGRHPRSSDPRISDAGHPDDDDDEQPITLGSRQKAAAAAEKSFDNILSQLRGNPSSSSSSSSSSFLARDTLKPDATSPATQKPALSASAWISSTNSTSKLAPMSTSAHTTAPYNPHRNSLLGMSRASSFSPAPPATTITTTSAPLSMRKSSSKLITLPQSSPSAGTQDTNGSNSNSCFHGKSFKVSLNDARRKQTLEQVLKDNGAILHSPDSATSPDFIVVEPKASASSIKSFDDVDAVPVLHFWIEYCLHHEGFVEPKDYFAALPARVPLPLPEGDQLRVLLVGFEPESPELYHARKLITEIGGSFAKQMKGESLTHVICATQDSFDGRRAQRARSCGIPVVGLEFLIKARQTGRLIPPPNPIAVGEQASSAVTASSSSMGTSFNTNVASSNDKQDRSREVNDRSAPPLAGCTISRSKVMTAQSVMLERKVLQLGGCWQAQANESTTHLLHRGSNPPRESKELGTSTFLVHPNWLDKCLEQNIRVDESLFPASMDPSKSLLTVLSSSDGSATGNFLSQASQSCLQKSQGSQAVQGSQQTQAELVAAAKPWHRSISADAARRLLAEDRVVEDRHARGRSEEIDTVQDDGEAELLTAGVDFDADVTLSGEVPRHLQNDADDVPPAPSSQTLFEGEEEETDAPLPELRGPAAPSSEKTDMNPPKRQPDLLKTAKDQIASADEVMELLRNRSLAQGARKKNRLPPRARKQRSDEFRPSSTSSEGMLPPEKVLEAQAQLDAQRAAEAAAHGYSLGMDKDVVLPPNSQNAQSFDASVRIVYDDPAAMRERTKLLKMLDQQPATSGVGEEQTAEGDGGDRTEEVQTESFDGATEVGLPRKRGADDTFGAGRHGRHQWENRNSESPTKRPVVRRQPLARR
ncbi:related to DNA topoisomerase II binding protein [Ustilago trichophora]|uniref:Related to DNA topoisomerase II binding protein n=1 Tax=Ustilago trichophora TaxID=86804 RepID=A0A5C3DR35_9BASI|nr:related to DNA topoisomerase II binding protein [Ustilago trichophora]